MFTGGIETMYDCLEMDFICCLFWQLVSCHSHTYTVSVNACCNAVTIYSCIVCTLVKSHRNSQEWNVCLWVKIWSTLQSEPI